MTLMVRSNVGFMYGLWTCGGWTLFGGRAWGANGKILVTSPALVPIPMLQSCGCERSQFPAKKPVHLISNAPSSLASDLSLGLGSHHHYNIIINPTIMEDDDGFVVLVCSLLDLISPPRSQ